MRQLLGDHTASVDDTPLRELFLQRLPQNVQMVLPTAAIMTLDHLAPLANAVIEVATPAISAVLPPSPAPPLVHHPSATWSSQDTASSMDALCREFRNLATLIAASHASSPRRRRWGCSPRRSSSPSHRSSRDRSPASTICWYHRRFGATAHHCLLPCIWQQKNQTADH